MDGSSELERLPDYILVTPVKNEEVSLPHLIQSITSQKALPILWLIVDDGSTDTSPEIISLATSKYNWIYSIKLESVGAYDIGEHYASVCRTGFIRAIDYCKNNNIKYEYICLSDADTTYPEDYFKRCVSFLQNNKKYGIVSGKLLITSGCENYCDSRLSPEICHPYGTGRVWNRQAFEDTNGYIITKSPDCISNFMAIIKGWQIGQIEDIIFYQLRETGGKGSIWSGFINRGRRAYYIGTNPLSVFNTIMDIIFISRQKTPVTKSAAYSWGYFTSLIGRKEQIENQEVKSYIGSYRRIFKSYKMFLMSIISRPGEKCK